MKTIKFFIFCFTIILSLILNGCSEDSNVDPVTPTPPIGSSIGSVTANPDIMGVNTPTGITFKFTTGSGITINDSLVTLMKSDASGNFTIPSGMLQDNGNLTNGDEIAGDGIFSGIISFTETSTGKIRFAATANASASGTSFAGTSAADTVTVFESLSNDAVTLVNTTLLAGQNKFITTLAGNTANYNTAMTETVSFLQSQFGVTTVNRGDANSTSLEINFVSGLKGCLTFSLQDANGSVQTRGGFPEDSLRSMRSRNESIPPERQTIGENSNVPQYMTRTNSDNVNLDPMTVGNRNVLIFAPYEAAFAPFNERTKIVTNLTAGQCRGFQFTELVNQNATVKSILDMTKYGLIVLATHGVQGKWFYTAEIVDTTSPDYISLYKVLLTAGRLAIANNLVISTTGGVSTSATVYAIHHTFVSNLTGTFSNTVVLNNSCEGTMNNDLENAFKSKGAKTYYGYTKVVNSGFCVTVADTVSRRYSRGLNSGQAFFNATDPVTPFAVFQIKGANDMSFSLSLINGDFETGTLEGYTKDGDGRVITRLGTVNPTQASYMGIISTGLGFTTSSGSVSQCISITPTQTNLTLKWNFLSEEFLEFIGSQFQDFFEVSVTNSAGVKTVLFRKTIDEIAAQFGATKTDPGTLINVSPGIVFDQGGIYMTDWQTLTLNVAAFQNQIITISFNAGDVGDSIYDTAILLDQISVQ